MLVSGTGKGLDVNQIFIQLNNSTKSIEDNIRTKIAAGGTGDNGTMTSAEMMSLQQDVNTWSLATNLQSNVIKTISDGMKNTIANIR